MSWEASTRALGIKVGSATRKLVLMGYANHAHKDGTAAFPAIATVADYAECDKRTAQRHVKALVESGHMREGDQQLVAHYPANKRPIVYDMAMDDETRAQWEAYNAAGANARRGAATAAGAKGAAASAQARRGDNLTPPESVSTGPNGGGDNLTPPDEEVGGDTTVPAGVTNGEVGGDTGVTQTTLETSLTNHPSSSSPIADAIPDQETDAEADEDPTGTKNDRPDVIALCEHLQKRIIENGTPAARARIGKGWLDAARLILDRDGRDPAKVHALIDWCQDDEFWRTNILSMPTFRDKYDRLRLKALAEWEAAQAGKPGRDTGMRRGYDDVATWGEYDPTKPVKTYTEADAEAIFGTGTNG